MIIRTSRAGPPSGISWVARAQARSRREIHRYASAVLYARRGGASATSGAVGGGIPVSSDWRDWRTWPDEREARKQAVIREVEELLQEAIVMRDEDTRLQMMCALSNLTCDLSTVSRVRSG